MLILIFHTFLMIAVALFSRSPVNAQYHNYLTGRGAVVLDQSVGMLEMMDGSRFMSDPDGFLTIVVTYGELPSGTLGIAMRGFRTCRIIISHVMNPKTSVGYDESDLKSVLIHEIGHCFGMEHFEKASHVMYWAYDGKPHGYDQIEEFVKDLKTFRRAQ